MPKVIIPDTRIIPGLGRGPFLEPIEVSDHTYQNLRLGGYKIRLDKKLPYFKPKMDDKIKNNEENDFIDKKDVTNDVINYLSENNMTDNEKIDNIIDNEENDSDNEDDNNENEENDLNKLTIKDLKKILDDKGIKYKYNDTKKNLIDLIEKN